MTLNPSGCGPFALVLDVETLDLPEDYDAPVDRPGGWPRMVEVAWQVVDGRGDVLRERSFLVRPPGLDLDDEIDGEDVHGIDAFMLVREGVPARVPLGVLADDVRVFRPSFVAHNADFDVRVVGAAYYREGMDDAVGGMDRVCTMKAAAGRVGDRDGKWPTLNELIEDLFKERREGAHRALADVRDTARAFGALRDRGHVELAAPERTPAFEIDLHEGVRQVQEAVERYVDDLHALPTYYDPASVEGLGDDRFIRSVVRRMSRHYRPDVADRYWTPYDAVSSRMALSLSTEDEVAKYMLVIALEDATGVVPSAVRYSCDALERAVAARVVRGLPVVTKLDVRQFYASVDYSRLVDAVRDLTGLAADAPFLGALRGSLAIPYRADEVTARARGLSIGVISEVYLAELFMERVEQDIHDAGVEVVRVNDEFYVCSESLPAARNDFTRVHNALWAWGLTIERSKTRVKHHQPSYGNVEKHVVHQTLYSASTGSEAWVGYAVQPNLGRKEEEGEGESAESASGTAEAPAGLDGAVEYVNRLYDSLVGSRLKAATRTPAMKAKIEEWYSEDGSIGVSSINRMKKILSFDQISHWIDYDVLTPEALWGLVPILHEYPRGEFHLARAADVLVTTAVECVHRTVLPGGYQGQKNEIFESADRAHERSTVLAEAAHLAILALLSSEEVHPHVVYVLVRRMYKRPDSLLFDRTRYFAKQVYDHGMLIEEGTDQREPRLPFAHDALASLMRWQQSTKHFPLKRTLDHLFGEEPQSSAV